ncbi:MAG: TMEM14 family protein [Cyanobacteria bacterium P01_D01_bin.105]
MAYVPIAAVTTLVYGVLSIVGGMMGYQKAGSKVSLISGLVSGLLLLVGAYLLFGGILTGLILSGLVSLLLVIVFVIRLIKTKKFMPAGLMVAFGIGNLICLWVTTPFKIVV